MEEPGSENPWKQYSGRSAPYLRARAGPTPSTGEITWSSNGTKRLADRVIELKDHENGVREHDILSTAIDTPEHEGSSSRGWKEAFGKEHEGLWRKKKWSSAMDPDRLKQEIKDDIFATLKAVGIDVETSLLAAARAKSSCASKPMVQQVPEEDAAATAAALPNPLSLGQHSMLNPRPPPPPLVLDLMSRTQLKGSIMFQPPTAL